MVIKGENLLVWVEQNDLDGNGSHALTPLAGAQSSSMNVTVDEFDATSKDSGSWKASIPGLKGWSVSSSHLYCEQTDKLLMLQLNRAIFHVYWVPAHNTESQNEVTHTPSLEVDGQTFTGYYGKVWINNFSADAPNAQASNCSMDLTGTGPLIPTTSLPNGGIGVSRPSLSIVQGRSAEVIVTFATGALTATTSNAKVTCNFVNGVATISIADDCPAGPYTIIVHDAGTNSDAYIFVTVLEDE